MEIYARPATTFVEGFIGSPTMNILPADYLRTQLPAEAQAHLSTGADLIGIRPEDLSLAPAHDGAVGLQGRLTLLEPAGAESHLHFQLDGLSTGLIARLPNVPNIEEGAALTFSLSPSDLHPFESKSGKPLG